jgi:uncharacterized alpha-E superfamily protein
MLSRVASSVYWMCRYLERADNVARFIDVNAHLVLDMGWERKYTQWEPLIRTTGDEDDFNTRYKEFDEKSVVQFLTFDNLNPNSIISCVQNSRENARTVREVISSEMWETLNGLYHLVREHSRERSVRRDREFIKEVHKFNHLFSGHSHNTMAQGEAWHFGRVGRLLERAEKTARMLDVKYFHLLPEGEFVGSPHDAVEWGAVLQSVSGFEMYRKQFHRANYSDVAQFLILDQNFPRSIRFCVNSATSSLEKITAMLDVDVPATKEMDILRQSLDTTDIDTILDDGLHEFIDTLQLNLNKVDDAIFKSFFAFDLDQAK